MKLLKSIIFTLVLLGLSLPLAAQFQSFGTSPSDVRWRSLSDGQRVVVAPDYAEGVARKVMFMLDTLTSTIGYGLLPKGVEPLAMPVVVHAESSSSNGITIMAPRRIDINSMPSTDENTTPWLRHLSLHEYRHAAQYAALFDGAARWLYYVLGEQALLAATGVMPFWWLEGDAVDAETQATVFGRALQPSFTMHYRAVGRDILEGENPDRWFGGSYNEYIPSHYHLGYQMVTTANTLSGRYAWGEIMDYVSRKPFTITPFEWAMRREWGMTTKDLFRTTFSRLNDHWDGLPERNNSAEQLPVPRSRKYDTPYIQDRYPMWLNEGCVVVVENTFDSPSALVAVDVESGARRVLHHIGAINTRPAIIGDHFYWSQMEQISSFEQNVGSVMCRARADGKGGVERALSREVFALYPTNFGGELAYVRYNLEGTYSVVLPDGEIALPEGVVCYGLAAEEDRLYVLVTGPEGMAIEQLLPTPKTIKPASRVTLSDLCAAGNHLYFGSIASGYDEVHDIDLATGVERRLTTSRYGSFYGAPSPEGNRLALAIYDREGYHLALSNVEVQEVVMQMEVPLNVVNPEVFRWAEVVCVDSLQYGKEQERESHNAMKYKPFGRVANMLNIHSWAPAYYRPDQLMSGNLSNVSWGITAVSQSLVADAVTTLGVYYRPQGVVGTNLNLKYTGLAPKFEFNVSVDNSSAGIAARKGMLMKNGDYFHAYDHSDAMMGYGTPRGSYSLYGRVYLPIILSNGYVTSVITPSVELAHNNNHLYSPTTGEYYKGQNSAAATLQWNSYTRSAYRNLVPRWGLALMGGVGKCFAPFATTSTIAAYMRVYTPAFGLNDGFTLRASWQDIVGSGPLNYALDFDMLAPRGARTAVNPDDRFGGSVQYDVPLCYPDWGVSGVVMLKRVRASLFVDTLWGRLWTEDGSKRWSDTTTFGADLWLDTSWLRLPEQGDLTIRLGLYFDTQELSKPTLSGGLALNF